MSIKKFFAFSIFGLLLLDQSVKIFIARFLMEHEFDLIGTLLRFYPIKNTKLSFGGHFIDILSNIWVLVLLNILVIFLFISGYLLYRKKSDNTSVSVKVIMVCGLAGSICSLLDKIFWGGSIDFLEVSNAFVFDLKDCYLSIALIIFVIVAIPHRQEMSTKEYVQFCYQMFRR